MQPEKLVEKAQKELQKSLFHKPNPTAAALLYQQAAEQYAKLKNNEKALECLTQGLQCGFTNNDELKYQLLQESAEYAQLLDKPNCKDVCQQAAVFAQLCGKFAEGAQLLYKTAAYCDNLEEAQKLVNEGIELFKNENKNTHATVFLVDLIEKLLVKKWWKQALNLIDVAKTLLMKDEADGRKLDKVVLWGCVVAIVLDDVTKMQDLVEYFNDFDGYYCKYAEELIKAYQDKDKFSYDEIIKQYSSKIQQPIELLQATKDVQIEDEYNL